MEKENANKALKKVKFSNKTKVKHKKKSKIKEKGLEQFKSDKNLRKLSLSNDPIDAKDKMILQTINHMNIIDSSSFIQSNSSKESNKNFHLSELKNDGDVDKKE